MRACNGEIEGSSSTRMDWTGSVPNDRSFSRMGMGKALGERILQEAKRLGYDRMRLDTANTMYPALKLYRSLGFQDIPAYYDLPPEVLPRAVFLECLL